MTLTRKFLLVTALVFVLAVVLLGKWIVRNIQHEVLIKNADFAAYYMNSFVEPNVQSLETADQLSPDDYAALDAISKDPSLRAHVLVIKIWLPNGKVVFSTDKAIEGHSFDPQELQRSLQGKIDAYLDDLTDEENSHERGLEGPIYEVYLPLRSQRTDRIIAVGEFYESASNLKQHLYEAFIGSLTVLGGLAGITLIGLYLIVRWGTATIDRQRAGLQSLGAAHLNLSQQNADLLRDVEAAKQNLLDIDRLFMRRVGLDLHDGPSQLLAFVLMNLDEIADLETSIKGGDLAEGEATGAIRAQVERIKSATSEALTEIRAISNSLFAPETSATAAAPLAQLVAEFVARTGMKVDGSGLELLDVLPEAARQSLSRVVIEGLTNSFKHSGADQIELEVSRTATHLNINICDNGTGIAAQDALLKAARSGRLGLLGMRHRVESLGGSLGIDSRPGASTVLSVHIPLAAFEGKT